MRRDKSGLRNLVLITQLGFHVVTPIFLCLFIGIGLDRLLGTDLLVLPLLILGVLSGGFSAYKLAKQSIDMEREALEKERRLQEAVLDIKKKFGKNAVLRGMNFEEGATARARNEQIGGHKA